MLTPIRSIASVLAAGLAMAACSSGNDKPYAHESMRHVTAAEQLFGTQGEPAAIPVASVDQTTTPAHFTRLVNLLELCALAVPDGFTRTGLPLSLQIICRPYDEATALRIGWAYEAATEWHERHPPGLA